jgi:hypothetical protein
MSLNRISSISILVGAALLQSCSADTPAEQKQTVRKELHFKKEQFCELDIPGKVTTLNEYYQPKGSENVYFLDPVNFGLRILNVGDQTFRLAGVLPDLTPEWEGVFTVDEKAKRVHVFYNDSVVDFNLQGKRVSSTPIPDGDGFIYASGRFFPPVFKNGKLYISYFPDPANSFKNPEYFNASVEAEVDLGTQQVKLLKQSYPATYREHCYSFGYQARRIEINNEVHGYVFPYVDSIYFTDLKTGKQWTRFFGVRKRPKFAHIPYAELPSLNNSVMIELVKANPEYNFLYSTPMSGYYLRELLIKPKNDGDEFVQNVALFDKDFNYLGETNELQLLIDSHDGLLTVEYRSDKLILNKLSW